MATLEQLEEARVLAQLSPDIGKHGKWKKTLEKEALRKQFIDYFGERMVMLMEAIETSVKKGDANSAFKALEQLIGKPPDEVEHSGEVAMKHYVITRGTEDRTRSLPRSDNSVASDNS